MTAKMDRWWKDVEVRRELEDIIDSGDLARNLAGRGVTTFRDDRVLQAAGEAIVARIGEAVNNLPGEFLDDFPDVPWRDMRGMRNRIAHEYRAVDPEMVWSVLTRSIPELLGAIDLPPSSRG